MKAGLLPRRWVRGYAGVVGAMDATTGVALVVAPAFTLARMWAPVPGAEALVMVRLVGAFVAAVGTSYLWALARGGAARLRTVLEVTLLARAAAGSFCVVAVAAGELAPAWLIVAATDLGCAGLQAWILRRGWSEDA